MIGHAVRATFDGIDSSSIQLPQLQSLNGMGDGVDFEDGDRRRSLVPRVGGGLGNSSRVCQLGIARRRRRPEGGCVRYGSGREKTKWLQERRKGGPGNCPVDGHHGRAKRGLHWHPNNDPPPPPGEQLRHHHRRRGSLAILACAADSAAAAAVVAGTTWCWSRCMQVGHRRELMVMNE